MMAAPGGTRFTIVAARAYERPVALRLPFRFGSATVTSAPQAFMVVRIRFADGREAEGMAAELMIPKWFDKAAQKSNERNLDDLRAATRSAAQAYLSDRTPATAFAHTTRHYAALQRDGANSGRTALATGFGPALIDKAVLDALCVGAGLSFPEVLRANLPGIDAALTPDLDSSAVDAFLRECALPDAIAVRHTIGLLDPLHDEGSTDEDSHRLPTTLAEVIARYGHRYFKIKLAGKPDADLDRLVEIAAVLDTQPAYAVTLDGNEQYADADAVAALIAGIHAEPALRRLAAATLYLEQPMARDAMASLPPELRDDIPLLIDEGDDGYDTWPTARAAGYCGVSSKSCKGLYKSVLNAVRCRQWNRRNTTARYFLSGEDLTTQAGLALQQDLALAGMLGIAHVERNGHHYVDGFAGQGAPIAERAVFARAHPDLYVREHENVRVDIKEGKVSLRTLHCVGFATAVRPDLDAMSPLGGEDPAFARAPGRAA